MITAIFGGMWFLDFLNGYVFKTYCLDLVEFSPLPSGSGAQMLWSNPPDGFRICQIPVAMVANGWGSMASSFCITARGDL